MSKSFPMMASEKPILISGDPVKENPTVINE